MSYEGQDDRAYTAWMKKVQKRHNPEAADAINTAAAWLRQFQKTEATPVAKQGDGITTPAMVEAELAHPGIKRSRPRK